MNLFSLRIVRALTLTLLFVLILGIGIWGTLAFAISGPETSLLRNSLSAAFGLSCLLCLIALTQARWRWRAVIAYSLVFALTLTWWASVKPSNDRDWQEGVAVLPWAKIDGDLVTVHNIRNIAYRSETDYTVAYYDRTFDLRKLEGVDVVAVHWMGPAIAHVFLSFAFANDQHLAISIETRNQKGEGYSTLKGFFRQYELHYVVADERDVIRLRTNYRHNPPEDVYVYRARGMNGDGQRLFLEYIAQINSLKNTPEFYNSLTTNCTTNIWLNARVNPNNLPLSWKILASGYLAEYLYENDRLETKGMSFSELQKQAWINPRAHAVDKIDNFSQLIRMPAISR
ncbi:DUF4105 domain-containing protein [Undibacterium sp.]|uniref:Lnb N-terminal periplasmic domain-containing protein n=1 Tax=Undibacterium sp. TaxID=1914977 RepID=UPI0025F3D3D2|nr:DUF4105 domain-containing protein [Undibacterium sp.]